MALLRTKVLLWVLSAMRRPGRLAALRFVAIDDKRAGIPKRGAQDMVSGLLALLDDVVALAKVAAASLDDAAMLGRVLITSHLLNRCGEISALPNERT